MDDDLYWIGNTIIILSSKNTKFFLLDFIDVNYEVLCKTLTKTKRFIKKRKQLKKKKYIYMTRIII